MEWDGARKGSIMRHKHKFLPIPHHHKTLNKDDHLAGWPNYFFSMVNIQPSNKKQRKQNKKTFPPHRNKHIWFQKWRDEKWRLSSDFLDTQPDLSEKDSTKRKIRVRNKTNTKEKRQKSDSSRQSGSLFFFLSKKQNKNILVFKKDTNLKGKKRIKKKCRLNATSDLVL